TPHPFSYFLLPLPIQPSSSILALSVALHSLALSHSSFYFLLSSLFAPRPFFFPHYFPPFQFFPAQRQATFTSMEAEPDLDVNDPEFWKKLMPDMANRPDQNIIEE